MKNYRKRIADDILRRKLEGKGAVLIEGPKWCGKTTTAEQLAASILYMDDPEKKEQNIAMSELNPKRLLKGATPRLIDEWQLAPKLWDAIRFEVDHRGELGTVCSHRFCCSRRYQGNYALRHRSFYLADHATDEFIRIGRFNRRSQHKGPV